MTPKFNDQKIHWVWTGPAPVKVKFNSSYAAKASHD